MGNSVARGQKVSKGSKKFSAVDLITVVVFSALVRVLWIVFKSAGVVFPFNHSFMHFFSSFCLVACMSVVQKRGTAFYYTVGWCAINFFLQGEMWYYWFLIILAPFPAELYMNFRSKSFANPDDVYRSFKDLLIFAYIYSVIYYWFALGDVILIAKIPVAMTLVLLAFAGALVLVVPGSWLGYKLGIRLNQLIG